MPNYHLPQQFRGILIKPIDYLISSKILLHIILLLLITSITSCKQQISQEKTNNVFTAQVSFSDSIHDFGTFFSDSAVQRYTFNFVNNSGTPTVILNVSPSCQCISVKYTQEAVQPGKSGKVEVTFDGTKSAVGYFNRSIRVRMNTAQPYILSVKGYMK